MKIPVLWLSRYPDILARGYADQGLLEGIFDRTVWRPPGAIDFEHYEVRDQWTPLVAAAGAVIVFNARTHAEPADVFWLERHIAACAWSVVMVCGDEEHVFPWQEIGDTPTRKLWVMQPGPQHAHLSGLLPGGWYPGTHDYLHEAARMAYTRPGDWFFAGQVTHERRQQCADVLRKLPRGLLVETTRYLEEGVPKAEYFRLMSAAKVVPCPTGPMTVDTARPLEAMEAGCVPVVDCVNGKGEDYDYWTIVFGKDNPLPKIREWQSFPIHLKHELAAWPANANRISAFWQQWKRATVHKLDAQIHELAGTKPDLGTPDDQITVVVTTSPVPQHPSTLDLDTVVASVRAQLPTAEVVLVADGVRKEQERRQPDYEEYLRRVCWLANYEWGNCVPVILDGHGHQANAMRAAMELVTTPLVLFVEHDTPVMGDIDWSGLCTFVASGEANMVRFSEDDEIHPDHADLYLDDETQWPGSDRYDIVDGDQRIIRTLRRGGVPVRRTVAWWQRPHLASSRFYRDVLETYFSPRCRTFIEDVMYPVVLNNYEAHGEAAWWDWRIWLYAPPGGMRRSGHLDSRGDDPKFPVRYWYPNDRPPEGAPVSTRV